MHFKVIIVLIVIEIQIRSTIFLIVVIELISILLRDNVSKCIHSISSSITVVVTETASNEGMNLVVVSLIKIR